MGQRNFGANVQDILKKLDLFFLSQNALAGNNMFADKEPLLAQVDQMLFNWKESKKKKHTSLNELELANEICGYCSRQKTEYIRYQVFDALFSMTRSAARDYRRHILATVASLAISLKSLAVLECVALWVATSPKDHAIHISSCIERDFCRVMPEASPDLKSCIDICDKFCSIMMSAFCAKYTMKSAEKIGKTIGHYPPHVLLDIVQHWVLKNPKILFCIITKLNQLWHTVLTTTRNPQECLALSPLAGLIQWSIKLPFAPEASPVEAEYAKLHSRLHFGVLTGISATDECRNALKQGILGKESDFQLWSKTDAHTLVGALLAYASGNTDPEVIEVAIDRFAQASQIAMASKVLVISKEQFQSLTDPLPKTKLLELVVYGPGQKPMIDDIEMT